MAERAERSFGAYLQRALHLLRAEAPVHFAATRERLGPRAIDIAVGAEAPVRVHLDRGEPWVVVPAEGEGPAAEVNIGVSRADLSAFLRGELTIEDGVAQDRLTVRGQPRARAGLPRRAGCLAARRSAQPRFSIVAPQLPRDVDRMTE